MAARARRRQSCARYCGKGSAVLNINTVVEILVELARAAQDGVPPPWAEIMARCVRAGWEGVRLPL